jgi:hypothetical protein
VTKKEALSMANGLSSDNEAFIAESVARGSIRIAIR